MISWKVGVYMEKYRVSKVFVPGGLPEFTYNPRNKHRLEERLKEAKDNLCKLVMVSGLTKSGKTVLTKNIFPKENVVWFEGGFFTDENEFWSYVIERLDGFTSIEKSSTKGRTTSLKGSLKGQLGLPFLDVKPSVDTELAHEKISKSSRSRNVTNKTVALTALRQKLTPIIIDDFHYIKREKQGLLVRALKSLIFDGLPVVFIAIPHRRLDIIKVEREMTGRLEQISIPPWDIEELISIPQKGFPLLNVSISENIAYNLANESLGSPHLMQEFCKELCHEYQIEETLAEPLAINDETILPKIYKNIAQNTGRVMFEKLARGPRQRTDRIQRILKSGKVTDIYGVVLYALAEMRPGIQTIDYECLRVFIKNILTENAPQAHEVSRVLDHMAKISASDDSSTPVIDWDKEERKLHITDPFFAYYLRWGEVADLPSPWPTDIVYHASPESPRDRIT
jgi:hypothetical protein